MSAADSDTEVSAVEEVQSGFWKAHQRREHITALELRAVRLAVLSFIKELRGRRVLHFCDNMAVVHILTNVTARTPSMMAELRKLFWILDVNDIHLRTRHIRSAANVWADRLSRRFDCGDWRLSRKEFSYLDRRYGPHSVDRFATNLNTQLPVFNSSMHCPDVSAINACRHRRDAPYRQRHSGFRELTHPPFPFPYYVRPGGSTRSTRLRLRPGLTPRGSTCGPVKQTDAQYSR